MPQFNVSLSLFLAPAANKHTHAHTTPNTKNRLRLHFCFLHIFSVAFAASMFFAYFTLCLHISSICLYLARRLFQPFLLFCVNVYLFSLAKTRKGERKRSGFCFATIIFFIFKINTNAGLPAKREFLMLLKLLQLWNNQQRVASSAATTFSFSFTGTSLCLFFE